MVLKVDRQIGEDSVTEDNLGHCIGYEVNMYFFGVYMIVIDI